jgi:hypothetical protein
MAKIIEPEPQPVIYTVEMTQAELDLIVRLTNRFGVGGFEIRTSLFETYRPETKDYETASYLYHGLSSKAQITTLN